LQVTKRKPPRLRGSFLFLPFFLVTKVPVAKANPRLNSDQGMLTADRVSPFVKIRAGALHPPIVIAHGLSGMVQFSELAKHIRTSHPIYGIQARGVDGVEEPLKSVHEMAEYYLRELHLIQPHGPYLLIGYSFGGLVAFEIAQRLAAQGRRIALLVLVDAFPHPRFMPLVWRLRLFARRMKFHSQQMGPMTFSEAFSYLTSGIKRRLGGFPGDHGAKGSPTALGLSVEQATLLRVKESARQAYTNYRPHTYLGKIKFVATEDKTFFPGDPAAIWKSLASGLEIDVIPGNHLNIVITEFEALAAVLTRYLSQIDTELDALQ
jgi:acetoacetyl-CoA synthetase